MSKAKVNAIKRQATRTFISRVRRVSKEQRANDGNEFASNLDAHGGTNDVRVGGGGKLT